MPRRKHPCSTPLLDRPTLTALLSLFLAAGVHGNSTGEPANPATSDSLTFEQHVRPILKAHCFDCHGEGEKLRGGLDLRLKRFIVRGGDSGTALIPGDPSASPAYELVASGKMPKRDHKPTPAEIDIFKRWIEAGAPTLRPEPEALGQGMQITAEERAHWSFQAIRRPAVPTFDAASRVRNPVDAFVAARLASLETRHDASRIATNGTDRVAHSEAASPTLTFSPEAPPAVLMRRVYLDLWGMPPTPEEVDAYLADTRPDAYERLVDRLLASPRYGERWARHWLDVAGYADSDGFTNDDTPRPHAYKYRDYVIRAFNADKPYDRFVLEQLAGDELALTRHSNLDAAAQDPETRDGLIATGYLRMAADGTASGGVDQDVARNQVIADTLKIVSTSLLGLTVGCAQCHDHRYEPIPQADYFRLRAVFEPAYDWKAWRTPAERRISLYTPADREAAGAVEAEAARLAKTREARQSEHLDEALKKHLAEKFDESLREPLWTAFKTPPKERTDAQKKLLKDHPSANIHPGVLYQYNPKAADELKAMDAQIAEVRKRKPVEDFVAALWEPPDHRPPTYLFHRGDPKQPREVVPPGTLSVLVQEGATPDLPIAGSPGSSSGRRLAFARWLTRPDHPLLARVLVNRVWLHHFGRGLVGTPGDFGLQGERPTHPELLDWLASTFIAPSSEGHDDAAHGDGAGLGWSLKRLHRLLVTSTTYRQSSARHALGERIDPDNRWYWRAPVRRLDAEAIRDSMLAVSGVLSGRRFGPPVPVREDVVGQVVVGIDRKEGDNKMPVDVPMGEDEFRRGVYLEVRRSKPLAFLNAFDAPVMEVNCEQRPASTVSPQALMLMNSAFALQQAQLFAARLRSEAGEAADPRIDRAWQLAYGRAPSNTERRQARDFLARHLTTLTEAEAERRKAKEPPSAGAGSAAPADVAWRSLCQALLSSNEFLYVD